MDSSLIDDFKKEALKTLAEALEYHTRTRCSIGDGDVQFVRSMHDGRDTLLVLAVHRPSLVYRIELTVTEIDRVYWQLPQSSLRTEGNEETSG